MSIDLNAQDMVYQINLTDTSNSGNLNIDVYNAAISVEGYSGDNIELSIEDNRKGKDLKFGSADLLYNVIENDNEVWIVNRDKVKRRMQGLKILVKVPLAYSVRLKTYFGERISVSGIKGDVEVSGYFTDINLRDIENSVTANTTEGQLFCQFKSLSSDSSYFFSNYKGNLLIEVPRNADADLFIDNSFGKLKSNLNLLLNTALRDKVSYNYVARKINNGGVDMILKNYFGDIIVNQISDIP